MNKLPEGKSYKRNDDDDMDVKQKKKQDQERREAKKQPVEESAWDIIHDPSILDRKPSGPKPVDDAMKQRAFNRGFNAGFGNTVPDDVGVPDSLMSIMMAGTEYGKKARASYQGQVPPYKAMNRFQERVINPAFTRLAKSQSGAAWAEYKASEEPVGEGKSFKRNRDEDADLKKKQDQERRDAKKQPMEESAASLADLKKELADLEAEKIRCKGWDDFPTARHEGNARIAELKKLIAQKQVSEGKSFKRGKDDDDDMSASEKKKQDQERREAKKRPMEESKSFDIKKGAFHKWLGKSQDEKITAADIQKGLKSSDEHVRKMAQFAKNASQWNESRTITKPSIFAENVEVGYYVEKDGVRVRGPLSESQAHSFANKMGAGYSVEYLSDYAVRCIAEGKSYKRNQDDDADLKKKDDKEKREMAKNKKTIKEDNDVGTVPVRNLDAKIINSQKLAGPVIKALKDHGATVDVHTTQDGQVMISIMNMADQHDENNPYVLSGRNIGKIIEPYFREYRAKGHIFTQPYQGSFMISEDITPDTTPMSSVMEDMDSFYVIFKSPEGALYVHGKFASKEEAEEFKDSKAMDYPEDRHGVFSYQNAKTLISKAQGPVDGLDAYPELCDQESCDQELDEAEGETIQITDDELEDYFPSERGYADFIQNLSGFDAINEKEEILMAVNEIASQYGIGLEFVDYDCDGDYYDNWLWTAKKVPRRKKVRKNIKEAFGPKHIADVMGEINRLTIRYIGELQSEASASMNEKLIDYVMFNVADPLRELVKGCYSVLTESSNEPVSEDQELDEGYHGDWAILPATMVLYGKRVVDIKTAASEWADDKYETSILVCTKNEGGRERVLFVSSSGNAIGRYQIGKTYSTYHDQTGASKGDYTVRNIVVFKNGEIVDKVNDFGLNVKASLSVFK